MEWMQWHNKVPIIFEICGKVGGNTAHNLSPHIHFEVNDTVRYFSKASSEITVESQVMNDLI